MAGHMYGKTERAVRELLEAGRDRVVVVGPTSSLVPRIKELAAEYDAEVRYSDLVPPGIAYVLDESAIPEPQWAGLHA